MQQVPQFVNENRIDGSIVMTIGAGDIYHIGEDLLEVFEK
jgi:UDP-N-acetylmuramate-alanine ligase